MPKFRKITDLPKVKFTSDIINNCFVVNDPYFPVNRVAMSDIFNWIKETAIKDGLTVELKDNNIMFIKGGKL